MIADRYFDVRPLDGGRTGLRLVGELDMATVPDLRAALAVLPPGDVTLDLAELSFIDSTGVLALVKHAQALDGSGVVVLEHVSKPMRRVLEILNLDHHPRLKVEPDSDGI